MLRQQVRTCQIGARDFKSGQTFCYQCLPGYSNFNGQCKITGASDPVGCGMISSGKCSYCRFDDGYRMTGDGVCTKQF